MQRRHCHSGRLRLGVSEETPHPPLVCGIILQENLGHLAKALELPAQYRLRRAARNRADEELRLAHSRVLDGLRRQAVLRLRTPCEAHRARARTARQHQPLVERVDGRGGCAGVPVRDEAPHSGRFVSIVLQEDVHDSAEPLKLRPDSLPRGATWDRANKELRGPRHEGCLRRDGEVGRSRSQDGVAGIRDGAAARDGTPCKAHR
mmetsp:Transcript_90708/g.280532  ORF Transcript_90708/g.280532 Transcript_90708/m.280532 type:complete len:205 (-) Transcript_90708:539-1153(-)